MAKKYECIDRIFYASEFWMRNYVNDNSERNKFRWTLLVAAYLLNNARWFRNISNLLITESDESLLRFADIYQDRLLSLKLACKLCFWAFGYNKMF